MTVSTQNQFFRCLAGMAFLLAIFPSLARAAVIYDNGSYNPANYVAQFSEGNYRVADDFSLSSPDTIRSTQFWGVYWSSGVIPATETFTAVVYGDLPGRPDSGNVIGSSNLSLVSRLDTGFDHNGVPGANILEFNMNLDSPIFVPTTGVYWFSIFHSDEPGTQFAWQETGLDGASNKVQSSDFGVTWPSAGGGETAFNLSNSYVSPVPLPAALPLFLTMLGGMGFLKWRRGRRQVA